MKSLSMTRLLLGACIAALAAGSLAQAQTTGNKVAVIEIQAAIFQTKDGQKALADLQTKFNPMKAKLDAKRAEIAQKEDTYKKGANTLSEEARAKMAREIDTMTKALNRDTDDANADLEQENQKIMQQLGQKMIAIINKYATEKGYVLVLDVSSQQTPVLWASNTIDITREAIAAYDAGAASLTPPPAPAASKPAAAPVRKPTPPAPAPK